MLQSLAMVIALGMLSLSHANEVDADYFSIKSVRVEPVLQKDLVVDHEDLSAFGLGKSGDLQEVLGIIDGLIAVGEKVWPIVEAGRPVVSAAFVSVNVLPFVNGQEVSVMELEGMRAPKIVGWRVVYENLYGMDVVAFTYKVRFQYGANFRGKGLYLANATVWASDISVAWGYSFSAVGKMDGLSNAGTRAAPVAAATLTADFVVKTVLNEIRLSRSFYINGAGKILQL